MRFMIQVKSLLQPDQVRNFSISIGQKVQTRFYLRFFNFKI